MLRLALYALLVAGCANRTGLILDVHAGNISGVASLELVVSHQTYCDRYAEDDSASRTRVTAAPPYAFLVEPAKETDLSTPVVPLVLAFDKSGQLLGSAQFGPAGGVDWQRGVVRQVTASLVALGPGAVAGGPRYVASDGCVCLPGRPWMGTGTGRGCDLLVHPSADAYSTITQCALPSPNALPEPACDGQIWPGETANRALPCFAANGDGRCHLDTRTCVDQGGVAYATECTPATTATTLTATTLCDRYLQCEQSACGDVIGCFKSNAVVRNCTLRIATPTATNVADGLLPCADGVWQATLTDANSSGDDCTGALLEGSSTALFNLGFVTGTTTSAIASGCPLALRINDIVPKNIDAVPYTTDVYITQGDQVVDLHITVAVGCDAVSTTTAASFTCN